MFGKLRLPTSDEALAGRPQPLAVPSRHLVLGNPLTPPWPVGCAQAILGLGCFWGAERAFWGLPGVWTTAVGYAGGSTPNPTYEEVCGGRTGHAEVVLVVFDPAVTSYLEILKVFWEKHDPTQGMRQGNDIGTQYRSIVQTTTPQQAEEALASRATFQQALAAAGLRQPITTTIEASGPFYYAEAYHQQYLARNPNGYCGLGGLGVACPVGLGTL